MILWRVVFSKTARRHRDTFAFGPWHPDKKVVENWAAWFRQLGHPVSVEDNRGMGRTVL
jgi:hypothetical protein